MFELPKKLNEVSLARCFSQSLRKMVESTGIEPVTSCLQGRRSPSWANPPFFRSGDRNDEPTSGWIILAFARVIVRAQPIISSLTFSVKKWWAKMDSNHRPHDYQSCALASWAIGPYSLPHLFKGTFALYPLNWITLQQSNIVPCTDLRTLLVDASLY